MKIVVFALLLLLSGCVVEPYTPAYSTYNPSTGFYGPSGPIIQIEPYRERPYYGNHEWHGWHPHY